MTPLETASIMAAIGAVGVAIDSAEMLAIRHAFGQDGIYSFELLRTGRYFFLEGPLAKPLGNLMAFPGVLVLPILQLICAATLLALPFADPQTYRWLGVIACSGILAARMLLYARNVFGQDGSDQMLLVVHMSALVVYLAGNGTVAAIALSCAAGQLILSYWIAGIAKAMGPMWRSGKAIPAITRTIGYGQPRLGSFLSHRTRLSRLLCWSVILFECLGPFLVLGGKNGALIFITLGLMLHIGIAVVMGLNVFVWSFAATYPAVIFIAEHLDVTRTLLRLLH
jgi:hypothetical protein